MTMTARDVLNVLATMHDANAAASPLLKSFYRAFMEDQIQGDYQPYYLNRDSRDDEQPTGLSFYPLKTLDESDKLCGIFAHDLFNAAAYQISAPMCRVLDVVAEELVKDGYLPPTASTVNPAGFAWLDTPWNRHADPTDTYPNWHAISWAPQSVRFEDGTISPGTRWVFWAAASDLTHDAEDAWRWPLIPTLTFVLPVSIQVRPHPFAAILLCWIRALWAMLDSEIAVAHHWHGQRKNKRKAARSLRRCDVAVITLRRAKPATDPEQQPQHRDVDWKWRWIVHGFWRHHPGKPRGEHIPAHHAAPAETPGDPVCVTCGHRIRWIGDFPKGPRGLPFKPSERVYRLAR